MGADPSRSIHDSPREYLNGRVDIVGQRSPEIKDVATQASIVISHRSEVFAQIRVAPGLTVQNYSGLMSAAFTIGHHFSVSAFWKAASAAGDC